MGKRNWTAEQRHSIEARGGSLLISAAAGSGKTAVLVERIIRLITDPEHPVDADRLLVVTFTRAAAAEMQQRLSAALADKMAEQPDNLLYQRQQMLLPRAYISTVHGFCTRLLQEFAARAGLPLGFRVAEESQAALLAAEALDTVLERAYRRKDPAFFALAAQLNGDRNDAALREAVVSAYTFMQAQPFPDRWLQRQIDAYTAVLPLERTAWMRPLLQELDFLLEGAAHYAARTYEMAQVAGLEPYHDVLKQEWHGLGRLRETLPTLDYDGMRQAVTGYTFASLPGFRTTDPVVLEQRKAVQDLRNKFTKKLLARGAKLFCGTEAQCREDLAAMAPLVEALGALVREYTACYTDLKRQQKLLDYNDLEHEALRLVLDPETEAPTPLAAELSGRFSAIMVDEYQDTNAAQDALFLALSRHGTNLFMVGDVKQSIYGFRQAMPELFTGRRDAYGPYDPDAPAYPATITLKNNFRSRREVTETVNFLFRQLMGRRLGGVEYGPEEELVCSAAYDDTPHPTEWLLVDKEAARQEGISSTQAEARVIAGRIRGLMGTMTVAEGGAQRPLQYGDVCILLRGHAHIPTYIKELNRQGIPAAAEKSAGFLSTPEIRAATSLLRVIDNPLREVELTAVMLSPLYGFTPDDLAQLRVSAGRQVPLYAALEQMAADAAQPQLAAQCAALLGDLHRYRTLAVTLPADRLLETVYRESGMEAVYAARSGGRQRVANLHQLDRLARGFEQGGFRGLTAFVRYMDRLEEQGKDVSAGDTLQQEGVRLMTVHGSKGLEFPVVFLARLGGKGGSDDSKKLLFHAAAGIGLKLVDEEEQEKHVPLPYAAVRSARRLDERAEELRVWYVALTRAREKLYLVYSTDDLDKLTDKLEQSLPTGGGPLLPETVLRAATPGELLLTAGLRHPDFRPLRTDARADTIPCDTPWRVEVCAPTEAEETATEETAFPVKEGLAKELRQRVAYEYPYQPLLGVPAKLAASQLSHEAMHRDYIAQSRPAFLQAEGMTAAQKGTALHTFMQFADYGAAKADLSAEIRRLTDRGFLTRRQAESLSVERIRTFLSGGLYARMTAADRVWREYHFTVSVPAGTLTDLPPEMAGEPVVVQGIADCVFREGDHLILVDYKTDKVKTADQLRDRYRSQMLFYKQALEQLLELPVGEMLLYSFALGETVEVQ
ncbi:MAG: helicase-exonuclease AddAB subunit AddA [Clostridia bacterium]|nr:helicase-exonuclease AddAB subunit AddA [Clostridia bacterium]